MQVSAATDDPISQATASSEDGPAAVPSTAEPKIVAAVGDISSASSSLAPAPTKPTTEPAPDRAFLWLRRTDQVIVWLLITILLSLLGYQWVMLSRWGSEPVELTSLKPREYFYSLDINTASWVEWAQLDGIGEKLARRIVADREERGPFRSPADVNRVRGIGPKLLEKILPFLRGGSGSTPDPRQKH